jgi:hypothetical protein
VGGGTIRLLGREVFGRSGEVCVWGTISVESSETFARGEMHEAILDGRYLSFAVHFAL